MSNVKLGKNVDLRVGTAANSLTDLSGAGSGLADVSVDRKRDMRDIPGGRGIMAKSLGNFLMNDIRFSGDLNATTFPQVRSANGQRIYYQLGTEGTGTGNPKLTGSGVARVSLTWELATDSSSFEVELQLDGTPTAGTY